MRKLLAMLLVSSLLPLAGLDAKAALKAYLQLTDTTGYYIGEEAVLKVQQDASGGTTLATLTLSDEEEVMGAELNSANNPVLEIIEELEDGTVVQSIKTYDSDLTTVLSSFSQTLEAKKKKRKKDDDEDGEKKPRDKDDNNGVGDGEGGGKDGNRGKGKNKDGGDREGGGKRKKGGDPGEDEPPEGGPGGDEPPAPGGDEPPAPGGDESPAPGGEAPLAPPTP